jgi:hypothetical protein
VETGFLTRTGHGIYMRPTDGAVAFSHARWSIDRGAPVATHERRDPTRPNRRR